MTTPRVLDGVGGMTTSGSTGARARVALHVVGHWSTVVLRRVARVPGLVLLGVLWVYQRVISPLTPASCRYYPSCSQYAVVAVRRHGAVRGGWLALRRLGRCHPWAAGGVDDVPPSRGQMTSAHSDGPERARSSTR